MSQEWFCAGFLLLYLFFVFLVSFFLFPFSFSFLLLILLLLRKLLHIQELVKEKRTGWGVEVGVLLDVSIHSNPGRGTDEAWEKRFIEDDKQKLGWGIFPHPSGGELESTLRTLERLFLFPGLCSSSSFFFFP